MNALVTDVAGDRVVGIDANNVGSPDSIFLFSGEFCIELNRGEFLATVLRAYGLGSADRMELAL